MTPNTRAGLLAVAAALAAIPAFAQTATDDAGAPLILEETAPEAGATLPVEGTPELEAVEAPEAMPVEAETETEVVEVERPALEGTEVETTEMAEAGGLYGTFGSSAVADIVGLDVIAMDDGELSDVGEVERLVRVAAGGDEVMAIVGVGGFLGLGEHDVAVPLAQFEMSAEGLVLPGVTEDDLEAMAPFEDAEGVEELAMDRTVDGSALPEPASAPDAVIVTE